MTKYDRQIAWEHLPYELDILSGQFMHEDSIKDVHTLEEYQDQEDNQMLEYVKKLRSQIFSPFKGCEFWIGYTNFKVSPEVTDILRRTEGLERLHILSPYRFIIGIGMMFDMSEVRKNIEKKLSVNINKEELLPSGVKEKVQSLKQELEKESGRWAILAFPNGNINHTTTKSPDFEKRLRLFRRAAKSVSAILIESSHGKNKVSKPSNYN